MTDDLHGQSPTGVNLGRLSGGPFGWPLLLVASALAACVAAAALAGTSRGWVSSLAVATCIAALLSVASLVGSRRETSDWGVTAAGKSTVLEREGAAVQAAARAAFACDTAAREAFSLGETILAEAESTANDADGAAEAVRLVAEHMTSVAAAGEEVDAGVRDVARNASDAAALAGQASIQVRTAREAFDKVDDMSAKLAAVVEAIRQIARKTHLLALNATIEAAHAGTQSSGFVVVAAEVKDLAAQTNQALDIATADVAQVQTSAGEAKQAVTEIEALVTAVNDSQAAIAASVSQQAMATRSIGQSAAESADAAGNLAAGVSSLSLAIRRMAYQGARADTEAGKLEALHRSLAAVSQGVTVEADTEADGTAAAVTVATALPDGTLVIEDSVRGAGLHQIQYLGSWQHSLANAVTGGTNSYTNMPGDTATLRFQGSGVRVYVVTQHNQGIFAFRVDSCPERTFDCRSPERQREVLAFEATGLAPGAHVLEMRCTGEKSPESTFFWVSLDRVEVVPA